MNDIKFYEKIPQGDSPVKIYFSNNFGKPPFRLHWHEHLEIHYIIEGASVIRCNQDVEEIKQGQCLIINSNELHDSVGGESRYFCVILPPSFFPKRNIIFNRVFEDNEISAIMESMISEYTSEDELKNFSITGYAHLLMIHLYRKHIFKEINKAYLNAYSQKTVMINEAIKYIHDNYMNELSLEILVKRLFITPEHLCRSFKDATNKTVIEYINDIRIEKAKELLTTTDISITEIAYLCGFNDSNYFSRKFKELTGTTPRSVRNK